ncbi:Hypothetical predicted protein, partial [Olea europaea subsp. europaea]
SKLLRTKRTRLTGSKSPGKVRTSVPTSSKTPVTPNISAPSTADSEGVIPQTSITTDSIPSSAPEIFYGPDGLPLPPGLITIEEIVEDPPFSTPSRFGVGITLYPSLSEISLPPSEARIESLRNILDRLEMSEQPSTSRTVSADTATAEHPAVTPTMFAGITSVPTSSQSLDGAHSRAILTVWFVPVCSSGIVSENSYVES